MDVTMEQVTSKRKRATLDLKVESDSEVTLDHEDAVGKALVVFDPNELTVGEKLDLVDSNKATSRDNTKSYHDAKPPSADSFHVLLKEALQAHDTTLLLDCLNRQDEKVITYSVSQLNPSDVVKLLQALVPIAKTRQAALAHLIPWLKDLLLQHASGIMSEESSLHALSTLYQGCSSSTAIVVFSGLDYYLLAYESRLSSIANGYPEAISDDHDKLIATIPIDTVYMVGSGQTKAFEALRHQIEREFQDHGERLEADTMDKVADIIVKNVNVLLFPMGGFDHYDFRFEEKGIKFLLLGTMGDTHGLYLIRLDNDRSKFILEKQTETFTNLGSGARWMDIHQKGNPQEASLDREEGENFCVQCVEKAIEIDHVQCGGNIKTWMIPKDGGDAVPHTYKLDKAIRKYELWIPNL